MFYLIASLLGIAILAVMPFLPRTTSRHRAPGLYRAGVRGVHNPRAIVPARLELESDEVVW